MMTRAEVEAILAGTKGVTPGPWVPIHNADQHGMIRSEVRQQDDDPTNKHHWPFRVAQTVAGQFANADRANFDYLARLDPQTVSALCTSLLSHMDRVESAELALAAAVQVAGEAAEEWDKAPEGMRAGKILLALAGHRPRYRPDTDAIHAVLAARKALAQGGSDERS